MDHSNLAENKHMKLKQVPGYICFLIGNTVIYGLKVAEKVLNPFGIKVV